MVEFYINGNLVEAPKEWQSIQIQASFDDNVQPNINTDELTFGFDGLELIENWLSLEGYYRGMPFEIKKNGATLFVGFLNFRKRFIKLHCGKAVVAVEKKEGLNELSDKIDGYTFGLLKQNRNLTTVDVPYVVEKKDNGLEIALASLTNLLLLKELYESIKRFNESITKFAVAIANTPFNIGLIIGASIQILIDLAYTVAIGIALKNLITQLLDNTLSPVRFHKSFRVNNHMNSFALDAGYNGFDTGISEIKNGNLIYFPSKEVDSKSEGIPNSKDYGYILSEFVELLRAAFNAKVIVENNKIELRSENDPYFTRNSTYKMPDVLTESMEYNADDIVGTRYIHFDTDVNDAWTIEEFKGTAYDVYTKSTSSQGTNLVSGFSEVSINACLASRKDGLNALETILRGLARLADRLIRAFGGNSDLAGKIQARVGMIKVSQNQWDKPKLLYLDSGLNLPSNNRSVWSAKSLYNNYYNYKSFVLNNYGYQRRIFNEIEIPFCLEDFTELTNNSYFLTNQNKIGKFVDIKYVLDENKAVASYWVQELFDSNLIETNNEP